MSGAEASGWRDNPSPVFAALGDPTRLDLVHRLVDGRARSIAELSSGTPITRQAITKHLRVLEAAGVIYSNRVGRENRFALQPEAIANARNHLDTVSAQWDEAIGRLRAMVEKG